MACSGLQMYVVADADNDYLIESADEEVFSQEKGDPAAVRCPIQVGWSSIAK